MLHRSEATISKREACVLEYDLFFQEDVINTFQLIILCKTIRKSCPSRTCQLGSCSGLYTKF